MLLSKGPPVFDSHRCKIAVGGAAYCLGSNTARTVRKRGHWRVFARSCSCERGPPYLLEEFGRGPAYVRIDDHWRRLLLGQWCRPPVRTRPGFRVRERERGIPQAVSGGDFPSGSVLLPFLLGPVIAARWAATVQHIAGLKSFRRLGNTLQAAFRGIPQRVETPK